MGVWDRDYTKAERRPGRRSVDWRSHLPCGGALALIIAHVLGFVVMLVVRHHASTTVLALFVLEGASSHPAAILLHPISSASPLTLLFVVGAMWTLGGRIESRFGTARLVWLYALGTIIAGTVYFGFAQMAPELAGYALAMPVGALAAWVLAAWRNLSDEMVSVFGRLVTVAKAAAIGATSVATWIFFWNGPAATGWLIAAAAGSLAYLVVNVVRGNARVATEPPRREANAPRPAPRRDDARPATAAPDVDEILAKINREGLDALTPTERERLEAARQARLRRPR
jgi:membrane associated rhomboid family serine protease